MYLQRAEEYRVGKSGDIQGLNGGWADETMVDSEKAASGNTKS